MSEKRKQINYAVACVSEFAHAHNLPVKEAFRFLFEYKAIVFILQIFWSRHRKWQNVLQGFMVGIRL